MEEVDTFALLSSIVEAYSSKATEPTLYPMSVDEMSQVAPTTYSFCQVCGVQGHYSYECSYNHFNSQNTQSGHGYNYQEGYEYNQYSNSCDQEWMDQPDFSYMDNNFGDFPYHGQHQFQEQKFQQQCYEEPPMQQYDQFEQQYYQPQYEQPQSQQYQYPQVQDLQVPQPTVEVLSDQTNEVYDMLVNINKTLKELKATQLMMEARLERLASSFTVEQPDSSPLIATQVEDDINATILANDGDCDSFSTWDDDVPINKEEDRVADGKIDEVVVVDRVGDDEVREKSNIELIVVSPTPGVLELHFLKGISSIKVAPCSDIENLAFNPTSTPILESTCFKADMMIVQDDLTQNLVGYPVQKALTLQLLEKEDSNFISLFSDMKGQEVLMTPVKVKSSEKPPPEPPPCVKVEGVRSFNGCEFFRCFITKFSESINVDQWLLLEVTIKFTNVCLETFCRTKTIFDALDFICGGEILFEKVDTPFLKPKQYPPPDSPPAEEGEDSD